MKDKDVEFKQVSSELLAEVRELYGKVLTIQSGKPHPGYSRSCPSGQLDNAEKLL